MLTCREVAERAQDYTDGNSSLWMRLRIRLHLVMCRNCDHFVDQTRKTKQLISQSLARGGQAEVSSDLMAAFQQKAGEIHANESAPDAIGEKKSQKDL